MFLEILVEGSSDVATVREILSRRFCRKEGEHFRIHPHKGKGRLPENVNKRPEVTHRGLLDQLPAKLRGYAHVSAEYCIVVLVDADNDDCKALKSSLLRMYGDIEPRPANVLFRIAVEETESWFLADQQAVLAAFPNARNKKFPTGLPDRVFGAWERLAEVLNRRAQDCTGADKMEWSAKISPHLDLVDPKSPSLATFLTGLARVLGEVDTLPVPKQSKRRGRSGVRNEATTKMPSPK